MPLPQGFDPTDPICSPPRQAKCPLQTSCWGETEARATPPAACNSTAQQNQHRTPQPVLTPRAGPRGPRGSSPRRGRGVLGTGNQKQTALHASPTPSANMRPPVAELLPRSFPNTAAPAGARVREQLRGGGDSWEPQHRRRMPGGLAGSCWHGLHTHILTRAHACVRERTCSGMPMCKHTGLHAHMCTYLHRCRGIHMRAHTYTCSPMHTQEHVSMYTLLQAHMPAHAKGLISASIWKHAHAGRWTHAHAPSRPEGLWCTRR